MLTDKELAIDLGKRLIDAAAKIGVLEAILKANVEGWEEEFRRVKLTPKYVAAVQEQFQELKNEIAQAGASDSLTQIVHRIAVGFPSTHTPIQ